MSAIDRFLLLITGILAGYQIAIGIEGAVAPAVWAYTVGFGALLLAGVLLLIFGFELLGSPFVAVVSTVMPLALSLGLVWEYLPSWRAAYLFFAVAGLGFVALTRAGSPSKTATIILVVVHGVAGLLIFALPLALSLLGEAPAGFALVGVGGALIGLGGLLLSFLKMGRPVLRQKTILAVLPGLLLLTTSAFVAGFTVVK
jgi:hypothetical protein